jgi:hypothetical protein
VLLVEHPAQPQHLPATASPLPARCSFLCAARLLHAWCAFKSNLWERILVKQGSDVRGVGSESKQ